MFAVTAQTAPGIVAVGRVGANRNSRGAARGAVVSFPDVVGFHASRSFVALGGAQKRGEAMRMARTAATEGENARSLLPRLAYSRRDSLPRKKTKA